MPKSVIRVIKVLTKNKKGEPLDDVRVEAVNAATGATAALSPKPGGIYGAKLPVGNYRITARKTGYLEKPTEVELSEASPEITEVNIEMEEEAVVKKGIKVFVINEKKEPITDAKVEAVKADTKEAVALSAKPAGVYEAELPAGKYKVAATKNGYKGNSTEVTLSDASPDATEAKIELEEEAMPGLPEVEALLQELTKNEHSIEPKIDPTEALQGIGLFTVVNFIMAGKGEFNGGGAKKTDVLGILKLFYGLQDKSLVNKIVVGDAQGLWAAMEKNGLPDLALSLDAMQGDLDFMYREAKRQFNLGTNNTVLGNTQFPSVFKRYVELGSDPLLSIDIKKAKESELFDKEKLEKAYDLLRDLKETIIEIVRSLSKYGTSATIRVNKAWGNFLGKAITVLGEVAKQRVADDQDEKNTWSVVAALTDQNRESIIPYVALGEHGAKLLEYAMEIYEESKDTIANFDPDSLEALFQKGDPKDQWTTKIRTAARFVKRYPLPTWG